MRFVLTILALLLAAPALAGAPVEQNGQASPCRGADPAASKPSAPWGVEIAATFSKQDSLDAFARAKETYGDVLGDFEPVLVEQCDLSLGTDVRYVAQIGMESRDEAEQLCNKLQAAGGACIVQKN